MTAVSLARAHSIPPDQYWSASLGDLALEAAAPLVDGTKIDALFCAAPSAAFAQGQSDFAAIVADRLSIDPSIALSFDAADASAGAAIQGAWQALRSGAAKTALVVGAAKVSDLSEAERVALMDRALDQEVEIASGLSFAAQAGLLAARYCRLHDAKAAIFAEITAANLAAWAKHNGRSAVTAAEIRRDLAVAPPLVRSDFAQLLDGAAAILLVADGRNAHWQIDDVGAGLDTVALWERKNPLACAAAEKALRSFSKLPEWVEIDTGVSIVQRLAEDALAHALRGKPQRVNARGGAQGRGRVWGASLLYQLEDILEHDANASAALALSVAGLGARAFAIGLSARGGS
jgi:acetyl-CoA acetyltransferase